MKRSELKLGMKVGVFSTNTFLYKPNEWTVANVLPVVYNTAVNKRSKKGPIEVVDTGNGVHLFNDVGQQTVVSLSRLYPIDVAWQLHAEARTGRQT